MNRLNRILRGTAKLGLCSFLFLQIFGTGCQRENPPVMGIRIETLGTMPDGLPVEPPAEPGRIEFPLPNVPTSARWDGDFRFPNPGSVVGWPLKLTNALGIVDVPDARVNAWWIFDVGPTSAPHCLTTTFREDVIAPGKWVTYFCHA